MSPLTINTFGIVNLNRSNNNDFLHTYCYHEGQGLKGGNNVVSMLHQYLRQQYGPLLASRGHHLVLVCDNCGGQNKNRMVIRYAAWLCESGLFDNISLLFLIAGHTKNPCNRLFNLLKSGYRKKNIYDVPDLIEVLNQNSNVDAKIPAPFRDWDSFLNRYYDVPKSIKKWHCFEVSSTRILDTTKQNNPQPTIMLFRQSDVPESDSTTQDLRSFKTIQDKEERYAEVKDISMYPKALNKPGIKPIKRNELWKKFRPVVPEQYHNSDIYQPPSSTELEQLRQERAEKDKQRQVSKKRKTDEMRQAAV